MEWCQSRFLEILDGREYTRGTKTKEQRAAEDEDNEQSGEDEEDAEGVDQGIGLGASLKYLAQGWEPTKPPAQSAGRPIGR